MATTVRGHRRIRSKVRDLPMTTIDPQCGLPFHEHEVAETDRGFVLMCPLESPGGQYMTRAGQIGFSGTKVEAK